MKKYVFIVLTCLLVGLGIGLVFGDFYTSYVVSDSAKAIQCGVFAGFRNYNMLIKCDNVECEIDIAIRAMKQAKEEYLQGDFIK